MPSLKEFSKRIALRGEQIVANTDKLVRRVGVVVDQAVVSATPVDTGRAKSNWIATLNSPAQGMIDAYVSEGGAGANEQAATAQAEAVIKNYSAGNTIHITNNLPYIQRLNDGYSAQAPANFVQEAVVEAARAVSSAVLVEGDV